MKIAVTAMGPELKDEVSTRFGRAPYFLIIESENNSLLESIENPNATAGGGAGVQSAQLLVDHQADILLTGNCGPKAFQVFEAADIKVFTGSSGTIEECIEKYKTGALEEVAGANVESHAGENG